MFILEKHQLKIFSYFAYSIRGRSCRPRFCAEKSALFKSNFDLYQSNIIPNLHDVQTEHV